MKGKIVTTDGEIIDLAEHAIEQPFDFYATKFDQSASGCPMGAYNITVEEDFRYTNTPGCLPWSWREPGAYPWKLRHW